VVQVEFSSVLSAAKQTVEDRYVVITSLNKPGDAIDIETPKDRLYAQMTSRRERKQREFRTEKNRSELEVRGITN
jgi:hypothetical protein